MAPEVFISYCGQHNVSPVARLTLLSDGSMVKLLRSLYLSDISVDVEAQRQMSMGPEMIKFLDTGEGMDAIVRDAWLCSNGRRLLYAHTFIDASDLGEMIRKEIDKKSKPVGTLLTDYSLPLMRDQLFITQIRSDYLAGQFAVNEDIFWARCYRLRGGSGFSSAILEIFSLDLFAAGH